MRLIFVFLILTSSLCAVDSDHLRKTKMISDLETIKHSFEIKYAPAEWKKNYALWDLDAEVEFAKFKILAKLNITVKDYQRILSQFFNKTHDFHVGVTFYSTAAAFLPFRIKSAEGRYFIIWVDHSAIAESIAQGDEVIKINEQPIRDVVAKLKKEEGYSDSSSDQAKVEQLLTERVSAEGHDIPAGDVSITVKHAGQKKTSTYKLKWINIPEEINNDQVYRKLAPICSRSRFQKNKTSFTEDAFFHKPMIASFYAVTQSAAQRYASLRAGEAEDDIILNPLGNRKSFIPALGPIVWESSPFQNFHAYIFKSPSKKNIGYIRISDYQGGSAGPSAAVEEFLEHIVRFQKETDALVIDQVDNPGGEVFYMYALATMLANKPLQVPSHRETITQQDVMYSLSHLDSFQNYQSGRRQEDISGYPVTSELMESIAKQLQFIIDEWNAGRAITNPGYLWGLKTLQPHSKHYSKPILFLVNEMSISCGDFMPAILQDNKRATIFGTQTAGAGGYVTAENHHNLFGIEEYTYTASMAERMDTKPLENLGVVPDIVYHITVNDLQNDYPGYVKAVNNAAEKLLK